MLGRRIAAALSTYKGGPGLPLSVSMEVFGLQRWSMCAHLVLARGCIASRRDRISLTDRGSGVCMVLAAVWLSDLLAVCMAHVRLE